MHPNPLPLPMGHSRVEESPTSLEESLSHLTKYLCFQFLLLAQKEKLKSFQNATVVCLPKLLNQDETDLSERNFSFGAITFCVQSMLLHFPCTFLSLYVLQVTT
ncbi:hypothetical protein GOODEAATRI_012628 [Goodea atripinnis]|uniref:Uncharacterized protein n=1 Tax=Goodea atripinnis TaxID=208336 RepID=A0ABV0PDQ2_9TELE